MVVVIGLPPENEFQGCCLCVFCVASVAEGGASGAQELASSAQELAGAVCVCGRLGCAGALLCGSLFETAD